MRLLRLLKRDLHKEAHTWVNHGLISEDQAVSICSEYGIDYRDQTQHTFGYYVLITLGYLFVGLAVIVLLGENWENIPRAARMGGLVTLTLVCNGIGLQGWWRDKPAVAVLWFFLGGLMYGATIMLIAQIYHLGEHFPDGIFWWALGVLPVALLLRSNLIMALAMTLAFIWFFVETGLDYYPLLFPLFLLALAWQNLRVNPSIILFLMLMVGVGIFIVYTLEWLIGAEARYDFGVDSIFIGAAILMLYHGLAEWLRHRPETQLADYGVALKVWILRLTLVGLFVFSFEEPWRAVLRATWYGEEFVNFISVLFAALALGLAYLVNRTLLDRVSILAYVVIYLALLAAAQNLAEQDSQALQVATNIVLVMTGIGLIVQGIRHGVTQHFYLGVLTILLTGLLRYIDLVGDYIGAAILFGVFAAILLVSAGYWKKHLAATEAGR